MVELLDFAHRIMARCDKEVGLVPADLLKAVPQPALVARVVSWINQAAGCVRTNNEDASWKQGSLLFKQRGMRHPQGCEPFELLSPSPHFRFVKQRLIHVHDGKLESCRQAR